MRKLKFVTKVVDKQVVVRLNGDVDASNAVSLSRHLAEAAKVAGPVLLLDMRGVSRMDSAGVAVLVELYRRFQTEGRTLALVRVSSAVRKILELLGTADLVFKTYRDLDEGLRMTKKLTEKKTTERLHGRS